MCIPNALKDLPVNQFQSSERRKLHFGESNFKIFQGEHHVPRTPLKVCASNTDSASPPTEPLHPVLLNATKNPIGILRYLFLWLASFRRRTIQAAEQVIDHCKMP